MKTIFIGPLGGGKTAINGATVKNLFIIDKLRHIVPGLSTFDTEAWRKRPWIIIRLIAILLANRSARYIISISDDSANKLIRMIHALCPKAEIYYWVIGGSLGRCLSEGRYSVGPYHNLTKIVVEGQSMQKALEKLGLRNVMTLSNFKTIPNVEHKQRSDEKIRFIFLSRIVPYKGTDDIIAAVRILNNEGLADRFEVDFYGPIEYSYTEEFHQKVKETLNISYRGFIDLRNLDNYASLAEYDMMLFPTFWRSEGCPGVIIDAYIGGLPIIASRWNLNEDYVDDGVTGIIIPPKDPKALATVMRRVISGEQDLKKLKENAALKVREYDVETVLSQNNLKEIGIV